MLAMDQIHAWCPQRPEDGVAASGIEVTGRCELSCGSSLRKVTDYMHGVIFLAPETSTIIFFKFYFILWVFCLHAYLHITHIPGACKGHSRDC